MNYRVITTPGNPVAGGGSSCTCYCGCTCVCIMVAAGDWASRRASGQIDAAAAAGWSALFRLLAI